MLLKTTLLSIAFIATLLAVLTHAVQFPPDTCASLQNLDLPVTLNQILGTSIPDTFGLTSVCLCDSGIPNFINSNPVTQTAVGLVGFGAVFNAVQQIVHTHGGQFCIYPDHSFPVCQFGNPCFFVCEGGFNFCNGQCLQNCASQMAARSLEQRIMRNARCPFGMEMCSGMTSATAYECIDPQTTLDSCGGCLFPMRLRQATGKDCSAIPGAETVSCQRGKCHVESCRAGMTVSEDHQSCQ